MYHTGYAALMDKCTITVDVDDHSPLANALRRWLEEGQSSVSSAPVAKWTSYLDEESSPAPVQVAKWSSYLPGDSSDR